jgi:DNA polymerase
VETFSEVNLKKVGTHRYAQDPTTELLVLCFAFGDDAVSTWVARDDLPTSLIAAMDAYHNERGGEFLASTQVPFELAAHAIEGGVFRAHNAEFERTILNAMPGWEVGFPHTEIHQWVCSAAKVAAHALPRSLVDACKAVDAEHQKNEEYRSYMLQVTKPRKPSKDIPELRWTPHNTPDRFACVYEYCADDVRAERSLDKTVPDLPPHEQQIFRMDQRINDRGVMIDIPGVHNAIAVRDAYKVRLREEGKSICGLSPTQTDKLSKWIRDPEGGAFPLLENLQALTITETLKRDDLLDETRRMLEIRQIHEMKAVSKFDSMLRAVCHDDRLYGMFLYHGASTGRWAGLIVQLHNLFRTVIEDPELAVEAIEIRDLDWILTLYRDNPMRVLASLVRSLLIAAPGKDLICIDYKQIEGRIVAWLANELRKLEIFRSHGLIYEDTGAQLFNMPTDLAFLKTMKSMHAAARFAGKTTELAFGYQGGAGSAQRTARREGVDLDDATAEQFKWDWREQNASIVDMWYALEEHARAAVVYRGQTFKTNKLYFKVIGDFLYMRLPSGRRLAYYKPEIADDQQVTYMGINTFTRQWERVHTFGGRLTENAAGGIARDVLVRGIENLEGADYPVIGHVHDEAIAEVDEGFGSVDEASELMCDQHDWTEGLPIDAAGFRAKRYRKD